MVEECDEALKDPDLIQRDRASTLVNRGVVENNGHKYDSALADFASALAIDSEIPEAYLNRGNSHFLQGLYQEALADYTHAIDLNIERMSAARYDRSLAYGQLGDYKSARADLAEAVALAPEFTEAKAQLALLDRILAQSPPGPAPGQPQ
jgi:tetratricopeptide (TPR) repeat protein